MATRTAPVAPPELTRRVLAGARDAGLGPVGLTSAEPFAATRRHLEERRAAGLAGGMQFTYRNPARSTEPRASAPWARTLVAGALAHGSGDDPEPPPDRPQGRVARYARGDDYARLRAALDEVATVLEGDGWRTMVVVDQNNLVDRAVAARAGLGWFGKSSLLLVPGAGSRFLLGAVVTDADLAPLADRPVADGCGPCTRCLSACPTGAIVAPGVVDARRCLSWIAQAPGSIPREHREALGDRIYGCDECQDSCPPNRVTLRRHPRPDGEVPSPWIDLLDLLAADDETVLARHGHWYIAGRDPRWVRRNALVALGNGADPADRRVAEVLSASIAGDDDQLAAHAAWAARRLGRPDLLVAVPDRPGPALADELAAAAPTARGPLR